MSGAGKVGVCNTPLRRVVGLPSAHLNVSRRGVLHTPTLFRVKPVGADGHQSYIHETAKMALGKP
jgi:hypothetical protein